MDLVEKLKKLDCLNLMEMVEIVKKSYLYVKPENKESFFKEICEVSKCLCTPDAINSHFKKTVKMFCDFDYLNKHFNETSKDEEDEAKFIISKIFHYNSLGASFTKMMLAKTLYDDNINKIDIDTIMSVVDECDVFLSPDKEEELTCKITSYFRSHYKEMCEAESSPSMERKCAKEMFDIVMPYLDFNAFAQEVEERTHYQYSSKKLIKEYLSKLNKKQLIDFYVFVVSVRKQAQLFMSKRSAYHLFNEIREEAIKHNNWNNNILDTFKTISKKELVDTLVDHADLNLVLWDNTLEAYLQRRNIKDAAFHVSLTLSIKKQTQGTNIKVLM